MSDAQPQVDVWEHSDWTERVPAARPGQAADPVRGPMAEPRARAGGLSESPPARLPALPADVLAADAEGLSPAQGGFRALFTHLAQVEPEGAPLSAARAEAERWVAAHAEDPVWAWFKEHVVAKVVGQSAVEDLNLLADVKEQMDAVDLECVREFDRLYPGFEVATAEFAARALDDSFLTNMRLSEVVHLLAWISLHRQDPHYPGLRDEVSALPFGDGAADPLRRVHVLQSCVEDGVTVEDVQRVKGTVIAWSGGHLRDEGSEHTMLMALKIPAADWEATRQTVDDLIRRLSLSPVLTASLATWKPQAWAEARQEVATLVLRRAIYRTDVDHATGLKDNLEAIFVAVEEACINAMGPHQVVDVLALASELSFDQFRRFVSNVRSMPFDLHRRLWALRCANRGDLSREDIVEAGKTMTRMLMDVLNQVLMVYSLPGL